MKTLISTFITLLVTASIISTSAFADDKKNNENVSTTLTDVKQISKIEVRGNVELYVSNGNDDKVKVYNNYYGESALVQNKDGVLRIASYTSKKLVVWVTASDLRNINAYDNTVVNSFGDLSAIDLNVSLYNNAAANLDLDAFAANITLNDRSKANLQGNVDQLNLVNSQSATVNGTNLVAGNIKRTTTNDILKTSTTAELAGL